MDWVEFYEDRAIAAQRRVAKANGPITTSVAMREAADCARLAATINRWIDMGQLEPDERPGGPVVDHFNHPPKSSSKTASIRKAVNQKGHV